MQHNVVLMQDIQGASLLISFSYYFKTSATMEIKLYCASEGQVVAFKCRIMFRDVFLCNVSLKKALGQVLNLNNILNNSLH